MYKYLLQSIDYIDQFWKSESIDPLYHRTLYCVFDGIFKKTHNKSFSLKSVYLQTLPILCNKALGYEVDDISSINSAWMLFYCAFNLLDKVEDHETESLDFSFQTEASLLNISTGLLFSAEAILARNSTFQKIKYKWYSFNSMMLSMCTGQHIDLSLSEPDLDQWWHIAGKKSGDFFGMGCALGASSSGCAGKDVVDDFYSFGKELGILIQIANDIDGMWGKDQKKAILN